MSNLQKNLTEKHSRSGSFSFAFRVRANQIRRLIIDLVHPIKFITPTPTIPKSYGFKIESRTPLHTHPDPNEQLLTLGKIHNLRLAVKSFNGLLIARNQPLSFWRQLGPSLPIRGYVAGRELREGCIVPSPGGGRFQLSNALYGLAIKANCTILERHRHTAEVPGSTTERDLDATVAFNHIDLRFQPLQPLAIQVRLTSQRTHRPVPLARTVRANQVEPTGRRLG